MFLIGSIPSHKLVRSMHQREQQVLAQIIISNTMLCFYKDAGLASRWSRLPGLQVMHLYLAILDIHNNLAIDKRAARLIDEVEEQCQMEY